MNVCMRGGDGYLMLLLFIFVLYFVTGTCV